MKTISFIERGQRDVVERILRHCGLWEGPIRTLATARGPPTGADDSSKNARAAIGARSGVSVATTALFDGPFDAFFLRRWRGVRLSYAPALGAGDARQKRLNYGETPQIRANRRHIAARLAAERCTAAAIGNH